MAEDRRERSGIPVLDPSESYPFELDHIVLLIEDGILDQTLHDRTVGHEDLGLCGIPTDPLDGLESLLQA